ncbi:methylaspartate mutase [Streptomyces sp. NPDC004296]|uniref:methylaspartate mutase n=1 Tax=Streptomyces sp. NPDC004296 TaxID=3364697 RepID=UPI0036791156
MDPRTLALHLKALPDTADSIAYVRQLSSKTVHQLLCRAEAAALPLLQPRCGVGNHAKMAALLARLDSESDADVLSLTVDSHTRLLNLPAARSSLIQNPDDLNGYPLITHTWKQVRELTASVSKPIQVRHGSPDARLLFEHSVAGGVTSFEGGGISYNVPYVKDFRIIDSISAWQHVDRRAAEFAEYGIPIERELFGTLTAVLVPPSLSIAISALEGILAWREGVRAITVAYPQSGNAVQDVAALLATRTVFATLLPQMHVFPALHQYMGPFPLDLVVAARLIEYGTAVGRRGGAVKIVTKTPVEAFGIPSVDDNIAGLRLARAGLDAALTLPESEIDDERVAICAEVFEILEPLCPVETLAARDIDNAFTAGTLDVPFCASRQLPRRVIPMRAPDGSVRYCRSGGLSLSPRSQRRNHELLGLVDGTPADSELVRRLAADIDYARRPTFLSARTS